MIRVGKNMAKNVILLFMCIVLLSQQLLSYQLPDNFEILVPESHVTFNGQSGTAIGAFMYLPDDDRFYTSTYGAGCGIRCFVPDSTYVPNQMSQVHNQFFGSDGVSWECASISNLRRILLSPDIEGGEFVNSSVRPILNGMVFNPAEVTVNGTNYPAGGLAIMSNGLKASDSSSTKRLLTWDLRELDTRIPEFDPNNYTDPNNSGNWSWYHDPSSELYNPDFLPDRDNAELDVDLLYINAPQFGIEYGYGYVNWNDAFNSLVTLQDLADVLLLGEVPSNTADRSGDKNVVFSKDGKTVYFSSKDSRVPSCYYDERYDEVICQGGKEFTGIWALDLESDYLRRIYDDTSSAYRTVISSEMAVISVGQRNLTGLPYQSGVDQILFDGTEASGNLSGVNVLIDDGTENPPVYPAIDGVDVLDFTEIDVYSLEYYDIDLDDPGTHPDNLNGVEFDPNNPSYESYVDINEWPKVWSITNDTEGNIYFYMKVADALFKYDRAGRLICVKNMCQGVAFNLSQGSERGTDMNLRLSAREVVYSDSEIQYEIPQLMYMSSTGKCVAGVNVFKPCDFDHDGQITIDDLAFFERQLEKSYSVDASEVPSVEDEDYFDYLKADLNGSGRIVGNLNDSQIVFDREDYDLGNIAVTEKDIEILHDFIIPGNADLNDIVDINDYKIFTENYMADNADWQHGDFDFDDDVDLDDLTLLIHNWLKYDD